MAEVGIEATTNRWDGTLALGLIDPHDSLSHPAGVSDAQTEPATRLDPDQFTNFLVCLCTSYLSLGHLYLSFVLPFLLFDIVYT